jgi:hypothetical protein
MFQKRTILALVLLAGAAAAVAVVRTRKNPHAKDFAKPGQSVAGAPAALKSDEVDELEISDAGKPKTVLKKQAGAWRVSEPVDDDADGKGVEQALKTLAELTWKGVVAEAPASHATLEIGDADVVKVVAKKAGQPLLELWIGKTGKVRVGGEARVWDVAKMNRFAFARETRLWRKREVFRFESKDVKQLEVEWQNAAGPGGAAAPGKLVIERSETSPPPPPPAPEGQLPPPMPPPTVTWTVKEGQALIGGALDETVAEGVLASLSRLDVADFADGQTAEAAGLSNPRAIVSAGLGSGERKRLEIGDTSGDDVFVRVSGETRVFKLRKSAAENLARSPVQWRDKTMVDVAAADLTKIEVKRSGTGGEHLVFERKADASWTVVVPKDLTDVDSGRVEGLAQGFAKLTAQKLAELDGAAQKAAFAAPQATLTLAKKGGPPIVLTVGTSKDGLTHVKVEGKAEIFLVPDVTASRWLSPGAEYKTPTTPGGGIDPHVH